jgi:hypothetical protein
VGARRSYVVEGGRADHAATVCEAVFAVLGEVVELLRVDAYSDFTDQMPPDIRAAQDWLRARGFTRGTSDPGIGIDIHRDDDTGWAIARAYAPWSIHTTLYDRDDVSVATLGDGGHSVTLNLTDGEVAVLRDAMMTGVSVVLLSDLPERADHQR